MAPLIFSLPNEIFLNILDCLDNEDELEYYMLGPNMSTIPIINFSMTCRRFRELSEPRLVPHASVDFRRSSLERFEEISRHPSIRKGVREVTVSLRCFSKELCDDFNEFVIFYAEELRNYMSGTEWVFNRKAGNRQAKKVVESWNRATKSRKFDPVISKWAEEEDATHRRLLNEAHGNYKRLYAEQEELFKSGEFISRVAGAMARMPCARTLYMADVPLHAREKVNFDLPVRPGVGVREAYYKLMKFGVTGRQNWDRGGDPELTLYSTLIDLPIALHQEKVSLQHLGFHLEGFNDAEPLNTNPDTLLALSTAVQSLEAVEYYGSPDINDRSEDFIKGLATYLGSLTNTPNLTQLILDTCGVNEPHFFEDDDLGLLSHNATGLPGSCLTLYPNLLRKSLANVTLYRVEFQCNELIAFIDSLADHIIELTLDEVQLLDGTWEVVIDELRKKTYKEKSSLRLSYVGGGEKATMPGEDYETFFDHDESTMTHNYLEIYALRLHNLNPLKLYREEKWFELTYLDQIDRLEARRAKSQKRT